jgi:nitrous oxide reductase accessory protein NosL
MSRETALVPALVLAWAIAGCGRADAPPAIARGAECVSCGMQVGDPRWACERRVNGKWRVYDSIECLLSDKDGTGPAWLTDWDHRTLHAADSLWIVHGDLPGPMGGGYAAFLERESAEEVAAARHGHVIRFADAVSAARGAAR